MICPLNPIAGPWFENGTDKKRGNGIIYIYLYVIMIMIITITIITTTIITIAIITMTTIIIIVIIITTTTIYIYIHTQYFSLQPWPLRAGPALALPGLPAAPETLEFAKFLSHLARDVALRI